MRYDSNTHMKIWDWFKSWYARWEAHISSVSLIGGFIFDAIALKRIDMFWENIWITGHLFVVASGIIILHLITRKTAKKKIYEIVHFWTVITVQFTFGGLLSTFLVFYFRSATLATSWVFLVILGIAFACNELMRGYYTNIIYQLSSFFLSLFLFMIYLIPILLHEMGDKIFILAGGISFIVTLLFMYILSKISKDEFGKNKYKTIASLLGILLVFNGCYFLNIIPPIPLSLKESGVYHGIIKNTNGTYTAETEKLNSWKRFFAFHEMFRYTKNETAYVYTSIFSPNDLNLPIIHEWQRLDKTTKNWITENVVLLPIIGGRDGGFRTYSFKTNLEPGRWRVNVKTETEQLIGRVSIVVEKTSETPKLFSEILY